MGYTFFDYLIVILPTSVAIIGSLVVVYSLLKKTSFSEKREEQSNYDPQRAQDEFRNSNFGFDQGRSIVT